jgi:hypothetical protein
VVHMVRAVEAAGFVRVVVVGGVVGASALNPWSQCSMAHSSSLRAAHGAGDASRTSVGASTSQSQRGPPRSPWVRTSLAYVSNSRALRYERMVVASVTILSVGSSGGVGSALRLSMSVGDPLRGE